MPGGLGAVVCMEGRVLEYAQRVGCCSTHSRLCVAGHTTGQVWQDVWRIGNSRMRRLSAKARHVACQVQQDVWEVECGNMWSAAGCEVSGV